MYYEDYVVGQTYEMDPVHFTEDMIIQDEEAAKERRFKGLIASGFQVMIECWGQWVKTKIAQAHLICSFEITKNRWLKTVYAGDVLIGIIKIADKETISSGRIEVITVDLSDLNQRGGRRSSGLFRQCPSGV